jgi:hypothetical protein
MPQGTTSYKIIANPALPYRSYISATPDGTYYVSGSQNVLTALRRVAERRPGFATALETIATTFTNCQRIFTWTTWSGQYIAMFCDVKPIGAQVFKWEAGTDLSAVLLYTSSTLTPFDFVVANNTCFFGNGTDMKKYAGSGTTIYNWGIIKPSAAPTLSLGGTGIDAASGYYYRTTFYSSTSGHESSPSDASTCTGTFSNNTATVTLNATPNASDNVTHWRLYRTTDGGSYDPQEMHLVATTAIGTATYADATADANLGITVAPALSRNDPPPASTAFIYAQGRIFMKSATYKNQSWFTGLDEISNGVAEECVPSGSDGNFYPWDKEISGHAELSDGCAPFLVSKINKIEGDTLDSLRRYKLMDKRGAKSHMAIASLGGTVAWIDSAAQVWLSSEGEIGEPIRTSLRNMDLSQALIAIHIANDYHWIVVADGPNGILYVYDVDTKQWMPPWDVNGTITALHSGETSSGTFTLLICRNGAKVLKLTRGTYKDDNDPYAGTLRTSLIDIHAANNPEVLGTVDRIIVETDEGTPDSLKQLNDDDPARAAFTDLTANEVDPTLRDQGTYLKQSEYPASPTVSNARRAALEIGWEAEDSGFTLYSVGLGSHI